ncbi:DNA/RNA helicase domain-containing protein, partial [Lactobacillus delbrueckii subsp. bulgaricus]|nr:ATP-dependent exonuclease [Lactobacillus delbrueckii subsp. bulgaricus]
NMLEDIRQRAKIVVAIYDKKQVLSKTQVWQGDSFKKLEESIGEENIIHLQNQMRIDAEPQTIEWLNNVIKNGLIGQVPEDSKYEIKVFKT